MRRSLLSLAVGLQLSAALVCTPACLPEEEPVEEQDPVGPEAENERPDTGDEQPKGWDEKDVDPNVPPTKVDVLLMIDNSGSMSDEQRKLAGVLDQLVGALSSGQAKSARDSGKRLEFPPVESIHIGIVSSDMGVNGAQPQKSCGALSFLPTERDPAGTVTFQSKPFGDDGILQTSTAVAQQGIWQSAIPGETPVQLVQGDPSCAEVSLPPGQRYLSYEAGVSSVAETVHAFSCLAKLGKNGCGLEQQLEAALKALTPSDSDLRFSNDTHGHGTARDGSKVSGLNGGFLRDDAILVVVFVSDEEDCSSPDENRAIFNALDTTIPGEINVRCGLRENQSLLHPVSRFVDGLRALKPTAYQNRLVVASVVGVPLATSTGSGVHVGSSNLDALLERSDMQFQARLNAAGTADEPVPACSSDQGHGTAAPGRRFVELSKEFGDNGLVASICENDYAPVIQAVAGQVGALLQPGGLQ